MRCYFFFILSTISSCVLSFLNCISSSMLKLVLLFTCPDLPVESDLTSRLKDDSDFFSSDF